MVIGKRGVRPYKHVVLDRQTVPQLHAAFDRDPVTDDVELAEALMEIFRCANTLSAYNPRSVSPSSLPLTPWAAGRGIAIYSCTWMQACSVKWS